MKQQERLAQQQTPSSEQANGDSYSNSATSDFLDDYDSPRGDEEQQQHQQPTQDRSRKQKKNRQEEQMQQQQWRDRDPYAQQGLFDDDRPPEEDDMW